jgi:gelsolin
MLKPERISWKDSNLEFVGSDLDHKIKEAAANGEPQWNGIGEEPGLKVWRIEQFRVVPWPEEKYGEFHKGDSYIVLNTYKRGDSPKLLHDIHFWIGSESTQDEYGTAAYKTVECDDKLGGAPVQHREVEGNESFLFKQYFGGPLVYLDGGVDTGFNHVEPTETEPHLYRVKGTEKAMSLTQMPLSKDSLNGGDSFILFAGPEKVWLWNGADVSYHDTYIYYCCVV